MKIFLQNLIPQLKYYSDSLDKKSLLIDKPWVLVNNSDSTYQKLIFKKKGELIMSSNGNVDVGKWEYLSNANSILLDRGKDKILLNHAFFNSTLLLLKVDGLADKYYILANENELPDLDAIKYLTELRKSYLKIRDIKLNNGMTLEIIRGKDLDLSILYKKKVSIEAEEVPDGIYTWKSGKISFLIEKSCIWDIYYNKDYNIEEGIKISIAQSHPNRIKVGDRIYSNDEDIDLGEKEFLIGKKLISIKDSKIIRIKRKWFF